jgi:alkanesulfonate monooxygenase SsuD/methylene tetrahydromethanopterin reductase-like flavin-dependent oxidoreductase (luciferase family)
MKLVSFHLMPYRPLDLVEAAKHRSPWVVLRNHLYDPVKGAEEYARHIEPLLYAEEVGFDAIGVNEHHQTAYGLMPAPNLIASALIQRTKTIKIAILGRALPLVNNPIYIAEEFAMLGVLSKGRIIAGFVRGIGSEYRSSGTNPYFSHERFHEAHDLIIRAWTEPGPFAFDGDHFSLRYVNLWPRPYQTPRPPVWIPSQGSNEKWPGRPILSASTHSWCPSPRPTSSRPTTTLIATRRGNTATRPRRPTWLGLPDLCR